MPSIWAMRISIALLMTSGCAAAPISSLKQGWTEMAAFAQRPGPPPLLPIGGRHPNEGFLVDFTRGYDEATHSVADWFMDAGWLDADFSRHNVRFDSAGMTLSVTRRNGGPTPYLSAEFQREGFYGFGRYEVVMRSAKAQGIVSSFFTHTDRYFGDKHSEVDFEFVGSKPREVHTNYFWDGQKGESDIGLWFDASADLHLYAFEWMPESIAWYVDGVEIRRVDAATASAPIPQNSSRVVANIWAANKQAVEWVGEPEGPGGSALYRCMSHVPAGRTGPQCSDSFTPPPRASDR